MRRVPGNLSPMNRACEPELLDSLPHDHPDAVHNRRDLRIINGFMRNRAWFERTLPPLLRPGERVLEIGAGMGEIGIALNQAEGVPVDGLDLWPRPAGVAGQDRAWHQGDLKTFGGYGAYPVVIGNLILHQFTGPELGALGAVLRRTARVVDRLRARAAQEVAGPHGRDRSPPRRQPCHPPRRPGQHHGRLPRDRAPEALGMDNGSWEVSCASTALGALNRMVAAGAS
jgi:hypothetical protein